MELNGVLRPLADDLPLEVRSLAQFLRTLMASLGAAPDRYSSWALHDPDAMAHYLDGSALPPRDVVDTLIRDLAVHRGVTLAPEAEAQARELHAAAVRTVDNAPGRVEELQAELEAMAGEYERTARREQQLVTGVREQQSRVRSGAMGQADYRRELIGVHDELARTRELRARAQTRYDELADRLAAARRYAEQARRSAPAPAPTPAPRPASERPTGARFAGAFTEPEPRVPAQSGPADPAAALPTGARFAGAHSTGKRRGLRRGDRKGAPGNGPEGRQGNERGNERGNEPSGSGIGGSQGPEQQQPDYRSEHQGAPGRDRDHPGAVGGDGDGQNRWDHGTGPGPGPGPGLAADRPPAGDAAGDAAGQLADALGRLRHEGHVQQAQDLLWEAATWPPEHFPALLTALSETGQDSDAAMLLWELSSRAPQEVAAYSVWLVKAERDHDWRELLSQASSRPHAAVADTVTALASAGWHEQVSVLLGTVVRTRPPEDVADLAADLSGAGANRCLRELLEDVGDAPRERRLRISAALRLSGLPERAGDLPR